MLDVVAHALEVLVDLVQSACGHMTQLVKTYAPQQTCRADLGKIQKYCHVVPIPDGSAGLWNAQIGDHIYLVFVAVIVEIG